MPRELVRNGLWQCPLVEECICKGIGLGYRQHKPRAAFQTQSWRGRFRDLAEELTGQLPPTLRSSAQSPSP
eukprot:5385373-Alexandrium_andersonii.AAC.1